MRFCASNTRQERLNACTVRAAAMPAGLAPTTMTAYVCAEGVGVGAEGVGVEGVDVESSPLQPASATRPVAPAPRSRSRRDRERSPRVMSSSKCGRDGKHPQERRQGNWSLDSTAHYRKMVDMGASCA